MATVLRNLKESELGPVAWIALVAGMLSTLELFAALLNALVILSELADGVAPERLHVFWPLNPLTMIVAGAALVVAVPVYFADISRTLSNDYLSAALTTAWEDYGNAFPYLGRPDRGGNGFIPSLNYLTTWEWDDPLGDKRAWRLEVDVDHGVMRVSQRDGSARAVESPEWKDLGGSAPWWDPPPPFSPHRRRDFDATVEPPPKGAQYSWTARGYIFGLTAISTLTVYFAKPSWLLFALFALLVPFVISIFRNRAAARAAAEQVWRIALAGTLTRFCTISDIDALQIASGRIRRRDGLVTVESRIRTGPAIGRWVITVTRHQSIAFLERRVSRGRFRSTLLPLPVEPDGEVEVPAP